MIRQAMRRSWVAAAVFALVAAWAAPGYGGPERTLTIWPGDLEPARAGQDATRFPGWLQSNAGAGGPAAVFTKALDLPAGAVLAELTLFYSAAPDPVPLYGADIWRVEFGGVPEQILSVGGTASTGGAFVAPAQLTATEAISGNPMDLVVKDGALYYLEVATLNSSSVIHGVRVVYGK